MLWYRKQLLRLCGWSVSRRLTYKCRNNMVKLWGPWWLLVMEACCGRYLSGPITNRVTRCYQPHCGQLTANQKKMDVASVCWGVTLHKCPMSCMNVLVVSSECRPAHVSSRSTFWLFVPRVGPGAVSKWCLSKWVTNLWSAEIRIGPLHFQAGCRKQRLNLTLVLCVFILCCSAFLLIGECVLLLC